MHIKPILFFSLLTIISMSCEKESGYISSTGVELSESSLIIITDSTYQLRASINPGNATDQNIKWTSNDPDIVNIDQNGVIKGITPGIGVVRASVNSEVYSECTVKVVKWSIITTENSYAYDDINCMAMDISGNLWCGGNSISKYDGFSWNIFYEDIGVHSIAVTNDGDIWAGTGDQGVKRFNGDTWDTYNSENSGLTDNTVLSVANDYHGSVWFSHINHDLRTGTGISTFDGINWKKYNSTDGLIYNMVYSIASETDGTKWFATSKGISSFDGENWNSYTTSSTDNDLVDHVYLVTTDNNGVKWFGTNIGVLKFDGTKWTSYKNDIVELQGGRVLSIACDENNDLWIGMDGGLVKFDGINWIRFDAEYHDIYGVNAIVFDSADKKWINTSSGIRVLEE